MFKKKFKVGSHSLLSGKDKKQLKKDLEKQFDPKSVEHFFANFSEIFCDKVNASGSKMLVYGAGETPYFVDSTGKADLFPTCQCCIQYPDIVPILTLHPKVEEYLQNGANLMWPGVSNVQSLSDFKADSVWQARDSNNSLQAIGAMAQSSTEKKKTNLNEGVALFILTIKDDKLSEIGPQKLEVLYQNPKPSELISEKQEEVKTAEKEIKQEQSVDKNKNAENKQIEEKKIAPKEESEEEEEEEEEEDLSVLLIGKQTQQRKPQHQQKPQQTIVQKKVADFSDDEDKKAKQKKNKPKISDDISDDDNKKKDKKKQGKPENKKVDKKQDKKQQQKNKKKHSESQDSESEEEEENEQEEKERSENSDNEEQKGEKSDKPVIPIKIMDEYIMEAFLNAVYISDAQKELPIDGSNFYQNHMLLCKRENVQLDMKNSSYKKIGKFFQSLSKLGVIEYKEAKKGSNPMITKINMNHPKVKDWTPTINKMGSNSKNDQKNEKENQDEGVYPKVEITDVYKVNKRFKPVFAITEDENPTLTADQVKNLVNAYITKNCKLEKKTIFFDELMTNLFSQPQDEIQGQLSKEEFFKSRLEQGLILHHQILNLENKKSVVKNGKFGGVQLIAEKTHNKNVTRVQGLETFMINVESLGEKFQKKFACAASSQEIPGRSDQKELVVQGNFIMEINDYLVNEFKIDPKFINQQNKLDKKKKK